MQANEVNSINRQSSGRRFDDPFHGSSHPRSKIHQNSKALNELENMIWPGI